MEFSPSAANTVGVEIELQLLDGESLDLRNGILPLMDLFPGATHIKPEVVQNTVEIISPVCTGASELDARLGALAVELLDKCRQLGMRLSGAGTHPFGQKPTLITPLRRYLAMEPQAGFRLHTQTTFATHVHIGMRSGDEAVAMMRALRPYLPLLIALSANSPFWRGYDTGCVSYRHRLLATSRSYGIPPSFRNWEEFCRFFDATRRAGMFESINDIHWDIRPRPHFGTLEIRVMDQQATVADSVMLASFVRTLVTWARRVGNTPPPDMPRSLLWWTEKENHFQATRLGLAAPYIADEQGTARSLHDVWHSVRAHLEPVAAELGESTWFARLCHRAETGLGHDRQRRVFNQSASLEKVVASLVEEFEQETRARATPVASGQCS